MGDKTGVSAGLQQLVLDTTVLPSTSGTATLWSLGISSGSTLTLHVLETPVRLAVHFPLRPEDPGKDVVENVTHSFREDMIIVDGAVTFPGQQRLILNTPVNIGNSWTIMCWFRVPMPPSEG